MFLINYRFLIHFNQTHQQSNCLGEKEVKLTRFAISIFNQRICNLIVYGLVCVQSLFTMRHDTLVVNPGFIVLYFMSIPYNVIVNEQRKLCLKVVVSSRIHCAASTVPSKNILYQLTSDGFFRSNQIICRHYNEITKFIILYK